MSIYLTRHAEFSHLLPYGRVSPARNHSPHVTNSTAYVGYCQKKDSSASTEPVGLVGPLSSTFPYNALTNCRVCASHSRSTSDHGSAKLWQAGWSQDRRPLLGEEGNTILPGYFADWIVGHTTGLKQRQCSVSDLEVPMPSFSDSGTSAEACHFLTELQAEELA